MSQAVAIRSRPGRTLPTPIERVLASAAGAVSHAEGVDLLLAMPDSELGRFLKKRIGAFRDMTATLVTDPLPHPRQKESLASSAPEKSGRARVSVAEQRALSVLDALTEQAQINRRTLLEKRALISSGDLQRALGITRQAISAAVRTGRLFSVDVDGANWYPAFFADGKVDRSVLAAVTQQLAQLPGWSKWDFFTAARASLGGKTPLEALRAGRVDEVMCVAKAVVEEARR